MHAQQYLTIIMSYYNVVSVNNNSQTSDNATYVHVSNNKTMAYERFWKYNHPEPKGKASCGYNSWLP